MSTGSIIDELLVVSFSACGHEAVMSLSELADLIGASRLAKLDIDAPVLPPEMCRECEGQDEALPPAVRLRGVRLG
jgi:hypothetical protein